MSSDTSELLRTFTGKRRLLLLTHTNPDPDSMASAMGLKHLAREACGLEGTFGL
jgi:nanoRNase/pAp phosphatase (c-di-AMP/oligoRNAs hydrolase)